MLSSLLSPPISPGVFWWLAPTPLRCLQAMPCETASERIGNDSLPFIPHGRKTKWRTGVWKVWGRRASAYLQHGWGWRCCRLELPQHFLHLKLLHLKTFLWVLTQFSWSVLSLFSYFLFFFNFWKFHPKTVHPLGTRFSNKLDIC